MDKEVYLIASHNTRIQCLINLIKPLVGKQIRFKNCCVIRIEITEDMIDVKLVYSGSLGEKEKKNIYEKPYYVAIKDLPKKVVPQSQIPNTPDGDELDGYTMVNGDPVPTSQLNPERLPDGTLSIKGGIKFSNPFQWGAPAPEVSKVSLEQQLDFTFTKPPPQTERDPETKPAFESAMEKLTPVGVGPSENLLAKGTHIFYIVRHGQALHNVNKPNPYFDTPLTKEGERQAQLAGEALLDIMKERNEFPDLLGVSDLKRTHSTLSGIITNMLLKAQYDSELYPKIKKLKTKEFVVIPCASELSESSNDGNCDFDTSKAGLFSGKYAPENFPSCTKAKTVLHQECGMINEHPLNWSYYLRFYGEDMRFSKSGTNPTGVVRHCRTTNMLYNILEFMKNYANPVYAPSQPIDSPLSTPFRGGKTTRKKRKTRRKKSLRSR